MNDKKEKEYIIGEKRLLDLIRAELKLSALESGGVDNWTWYSDSMHDYCNDYIKENNINVDNYKDFFDIYDIADIEIKSYKEVQ